MDCGCPSGYAARVAVPILPQGVRANVCGLLLPNTKYEGVHIVGHDEGIRINGHYTGGRVSWPGCYPAEAEYSTKGISYLCAICKIKVPAEKWDAHVAKNAPRPIRSGDLIATGTGAARRRLTQAEAQAGGLPERMTPEEWAAMAKASKGEA